MHGHRVSAATHHLANILQIVANPLRLKPGGKPVMARCIVTDNNAAANSFIASQNARARAYPIKNGNLLDSACDVIAMNAQLNLIDTKNIRFNIKNIHQK